jgi:hypothetical protein
LPRHILGLKVPLSLFELEDSMRWSQNSVKSEFPELSTHGPAGRVGVGADLTKNRIRPKISTTRRATPPGYHTIGGNQAMGSALMVQEVEKVDPLLTAEDVA